MRGDRASARQHNMVALAGGNRRVQEANPFVRSVTEGFCGRCATSAQDNDFRRFPVFSERWGQLPAVGRQDAHGPLDDERAVRLGGDRDEGHVSKYTHVLMLLVTFGPARATAQAPLAPPAASRMVYGIDFGAVTAFDDAVIQVGFRAMPSRGGIGGADISIATFPDALAAGVVILTFDADFTYGTPRGDHEGSVVFFPRAGLSALAAGGVGGGGGGAVFGFNVGAGLLAKVTPKLGLRLDYIHRRLMDDGELFPLSSISVGFVFLR
jgi:hypothetical protein